MFQNENIKIFSKIVNLKKKIYNSHLNNVCVMFYYKIMWFYQDFRNEILLFKSVLSSRCENSGPVTRDYVKASQIRNETPS